MLYQVISTGIVLAQEESEPGSVVASLLVWLVIGGGIYFVFFGPQRRRMKAMRAEAQQVRESVDYGDEIITVGGIYGRVTSTTEEDVTIDVGGGNEIRITRRAVAERIGDETE